MLDAIGSPIFEPLTAVMSPAGILIEIGRLSSDPTPLPLFDVLKKRLTLRSYLVHETIEDPARRETAKALSWTGGVRHAAAVVARTLAFERILKAHRPFSEAGEQIEGLVYAVSRTGYLRRTQRFRPPPSSIATTTSLPVAMEEIRLFSPQAEEP